MPTYNLRDEMAKAARTVVYGNIDLANDPRGYIRANSHRDAADAAIGRLKQLSEGADKDIAGMHRKSQSITALHFKKAIEDFSVTANSLHNAGDERNAQIARKAFEILVKTYINSTDDVDVYRALPKGEILDIGGLG